MNADQTLNSTQQERARWMSILAKAPAAELAASVQQFGELPSYLWLRKPETGLAMVRARTGGSGSQFNLGEMSVTRCALRLATGETGVAYVAGRDQRHAEWAAIFDALMQGEHGPAVETNIIKPLEALLQQKREQLQAEAQATRVEFMTMVRGEDA
ncbi:phosphonate C-P lyase system protein PhnG [Undibacterium umbellatum]|jgi:alpha-D-ribose 1-methylphosphonate 5-triphosphate synthase subunit PhnG|uniref:Phosphonate C-P lyase system protein PhnG n=1 Tax=Undibacterium umbellatum TaxID=2762300 RepID=A0ABR6Z9Q7_9BURK|nr:phosphonate C-P lyase system protein PhnG [Undibacterium umbellatum]MBC3908496.1 phosphonate C-P lyase system protein PhnG [Undibacterium umbellatum]